MSTSLPATPRLKTTTPSFLKLSGKNVLSYTDHAWLWSALLFTVIASIVGICTAKKGVSGFFFANRNLRFLPVACSMFMANIGSAHFVGMAGLASHSGITIFAYELNATFAFIILGWIFLPVYIASGSLTTIDYLKKRFGGLRLELYLAALSLVLIVFTKTSVELYAIFKLLEAIFGRVDFRTVCIPPLVWSVFVTCSGGLQAVVYTDTAQAFVLFIGAGFISYYTLGQFESYDFMREKFFEAWPNTTKLHFGDDSSYPYTYCGIPKALSWNMFRSYSNTDLPWPGMVFGIMISAIWYFCCDQLIVQFGLGAKSIVHAKWACLLTSYGKILTILFLIFPGIVARILYTDIVACADPTVCQNTCKSRSGCSNLAFPLLFLDVVPQNYRGLVLAAVLSCCVSSITACLNSGSTIFAINIYRNVRPAASELELMVATKISIVCLAILSLMWVPVVGSMPAVMDYIQAVTSILAPPIAAVFLAGLFWERATEKCVFTALLLGIAVGSIRFLWSFIRGTVTCGEEHTSPVPHILSHFHYLHFGIFLFVLCFAYIIISGIFAEPISEVHLYRLLYWLRLSKLDRVDIDELETTFKKLLAEDEDGDDVPEEVEPAPPLFQCPSCVNKLCCVRPEMGSHLITNNELRETVKINANIEEPPRYARALNMQMILLLMVSAVLWGFLA